MTARQQILDKLRQSKARDAVAPPGNATPVPATALPTDRRALTEIFIERARASGADVQFAHSEDQLIETFLQAGTGALTTPEQQLHQQFPTATQYGVEGQRILVRADAAIAETGTLCLQSAQVPSRSLFLCEHLLVLVEAADILPCQEDYWHRYPQNSARAVHLITGPSRTADVEQTLQIGAHGPRTLTCLVVQNS